MKLTVSRAELLEGLDRVLGAVEKRGVLPLLSHVLFKVYLSRIELAATDLQVYASTELPAPLVELGGETAVPAERFRAVVDRSGEEIAITMEEGLILRLASDGRLFDLPCLDAADFPAPFETAYTSPFALDYSVLPGIVKGLRHAISTDGTKCHLGGIHLFFKGKAVTAAATDGHRLSLAVRDLSGPYAPCFAFTLPSRACGILSGCNSRIEVSYPESGTLVDFNLPKCNLGVRLLEGDFPEYRKVVPADLPFGITVNTTALVEALESCGVMGEGANKSVLLSTVDGNLVLTTLGMSGTAKVSIPYMGDDIEQVRMNSKYLLQAARALGGEELFLKSGGALRPVVLVPVDHGQWTERLEVIMPMRA